MKKIYFYTILMSVLSACVRQSLPSELPRFTFGNAKNEPIHLQPTFESVEIIPLETMSKSLLRNIEKVEAFDSLLFVMDRDVLLAFRRDGRFVAQIGQYGEGPDEYAGMLSFFVDKKNRHVVVVDVIKSALIRYDFAGCFISSRKIPQMAVNGITQVVQYNDSLLIFSHRISDETRMAYTVLNGDNAQHYFPFAPITATGYSTFLSRHQMSQSADEILFIMPLCDTVFSFSNKGFQAKYVINLPADMAPREKFQITQGRRFFNLVAEYADKGYFTGFTSIYETKNHLLLECSHQGNVQCYYFVDKNTLKGNYHLGAIKNPLEEVPLFNLCGAFDNTLIGFVSADNLLYFKNSAEASESPRIEELKKVMQSLQFDDNPVLFFYHDF